MERTWEVLYESPLPGFGNKTGVSYLRATQEVIEVYCQENCVMIRQDLAKGLGGVVWDCGMVMVDFLNENPSFVFNKLCVDIGCGTGVVGICAGVLGSKQVILCDNVEFSVVHENMNPIQSQGIDCTFCMYEWGSLADHAPLERFLNSSSTNDYIDTLLGSDILYASDSYPQLEKTLQSLRFRQLIVTYKRRHDERERQFLLRLEQRFHIQLMNFDETATNPPLRSNSDSSSRSGVYILRLVPRHCSTDRTIL